MPSTGPAASWWLADVNPLNWIWEVFLDVLRSILRGEWMSSRQFSHFCASLSPVEGTINSAMQGTSQEHQEQCLCCHLVDEALLVQFMVPDSSCPSYPPCLRASGKLGAHPTTLPCFTPVFYAHHFPLICPWRQSCVSCLLNPFSALSSQRWGRDLGSRRQLGSRLSPVVSSQKMSLSVGLLTSFSLWIPSVFGPPAKVPYKRTKQC